MCKIKPFLSGFRQDISSCCNLCIVIFTMKGFLCASYTLQFVSALYGKLADHIISQVGSTPVILTGSFLTSSNQSSIVWEKTNSVLCTSKFQSSDGKNYLIHQTEMIMGIVLAMYYIHMNVPIGNFCCVIIFWADPLSM